MVVALSDNDEGGVYTPLKLVSGDVIKAINPHVRSKALTLAYTTFGEPFTKYDKCFPESKEDAEFAKQFVTRAHELLAAKIIKTAHADIKRGGKGLEGIVVGLDELRHDKVSGTKLVYTMEFSQLELRKSQFLNGEWR